MSGIAGIVSAYLGLGVWALVVQQLASQLSVSLFLWFTIRWRPVLSFSPRRVKALFSFGWKMLVSGLLHVVYMDMRTLVIGKIYSSSMLGFYNRGGQIFPKVIGGANIDGSIQAVMLPTFSAHQDNKKKSQRHDAANDHRKFVFSVSGDGWIGCDCGTASRSRLNL